jgi:hypothetical protein
MRLSKLTSQEGLGVGELSGCRIAGMLRHYTSGSDVCLVIASEAKQSRSRTAKHWIASLRSQ